MNEKERLLSEIERKDKIIKWYEKRYGPYIEKRGIHNWKNLFRKPNIYEIVILFMLVMFFVLIFAYVHDIKAAFNNGCLTCLINPPAEAFTGLINTNFSTEYSRSYLS